MIYSFYDPDHGERAGLGTAASSTTVRGGANPCATAEIHTAAARVSSHKAPSVMMLRDHWDRIGEDRFGPLPVHYAVFNESVFVN